MKKIYLKSIWITMLLFYVQNLSAHSGGANLFDETTHIIYINFAQPDYWSPLQANKAADDSNDTNAYIPAQIIVDGQTLESVGIQFKGNSSYYNYPGNKKPFTLSFDEYIDGQVCDSLKSLNLNNLYQDPSFMREKMFLDFANEKGLNAPRANYAKLYINNQYWGLYLICERIKKLFTKGRFGNSDGNLYKGDKGSSACVNLQYHGVMNPYYHCYELTNNKTTNDWTDLINLTYQIYNPTDAQFNSSVSAVLNTQSFIGAWAAYNLFCDFDSYPYRYTHNYYTYHNTATDKFEWIIGDVSTAFGLDIPGTISSIENKSILYITPDVDYRPLELPCDKDTQNTIKLIDVLWFQKGTNNIIGAFEVEKSISIYSGILRLSLLHFSISDGNEVFYIIIPDTREKDVIQQLNRPVIKNLKINIKYILFSKLRANCDAICKFGTDHSIMEKIAKTTTNY